MATQAAHEATAPDGGNGSPDGESDPTLERLPDALKAAGAGDFSVRLPGRRKGTAGEVERAFNALVERNAQLTAELARTEAKLPAPTRKVLEQRRTADAVFLNKRILIVDDEIRNVFALTSALEMRGMRVDYAEDGREGIVRLTEHPDVDLVLLDVMMPEMDGYETPRTIRTMSRFEELPIISLTAKAMRGDRDKSLAAGASDYITKPVDMDQLPALMRVSLHR